MEELSKSLFSNYIIDGVVMDSTPADMLMECFSPDDWERIFPFEKQGGCGENIVDETGDADPVPLKYEFSKFEDYGRKIRDGLPDTARNSVSLRHPFSSSRVILAETVLRRLLRRRSSELEGMPMSLHIVWDFAPVGNMAAFYRTVEAVSGYASDLGLRFTGLVFTESEGAHEISFGFEGGLSDVDGAGAADEGKLPDKLTVCDGILIYVPFDTCSHKLGGSLFSCVLGGGDEVEPEIYDPDYFIDSYEVVHDLAEDGIALSGAVVGRGGLITAVEGLLGDHRIEMDLGGIQNTYMEDDPMRILFSEIPGVVLQISEGDRDYVDSQFLLQDIAYYPLGKPEPAEGDGWKIRLSVESRDDLSRILSSLLEGQKSEDPEISNFAEGAETARGGEE